MLVTACLNPVRHHQLLAWQGVMPRAGQGQCRVYNTDTTVRVALAGGWGLHAPVGAQDRGCGDLENRACARCFVVGRPLLKAEVAVRGLRGVR